MALAEINIFSQEGNGARCIPFRIPSADIANFDQFASARHLFVEHKKPRRNQEAITVYVCAKETAQGLSDLRRFIQRGFVAFSAGEVVAKSRTHAA